MMIEMADLKDKVVLITGANKGIGLGIAEVLIRQGMNVVLTSRTQQKADAAAEELNRLGGGQAIGVECEVSDYDSVERVVKSTLQKHGRLDALVANAGVGHFAPIEDMTHEQWHETINTNLTGVFNTVKACVEPLKESKGYIITISSLAGTNFFPTASAYNASKFGLTGFSQSIMLDLRKYGVKVSTIMPGSVTSHFNGHTPSEKDAWKIQPEDIGQIVLDLLEMHPRTLPSKVEVRPSQPPSA